MATKPGCCSAAHSYMPSACVTKPRAHPSSLCMLAPLPSLLQLLTPVVEGILQADMRRFAEYALSKQKEASNAAT